jgi:hypothetical protein
MSKSEVIPMKWEYASLERKDILYSPPPATGRTTHTFYGPHEQQGITGDISVVILNSLGQDGWEVLGVEVVHYSGPTEVRTFRLKRPLSADS